MQRTLVAGDAAPRDHEQPKREHGGQQRRESERLEDADAFPEPRHHRDLHRAGETRRHGKHGC